MAETQNCMTIEVTFSITAAGFSEVLRSESLCRKLTQGLLKTGTSHFRKITVCWRGKFTCRTVTGSVLTAEKHWKFLYHFSSM